MKASTPRSFLLRVRLTASERKAIEQIAEAEQRTVSNLVRYALASYIKNGQR